MFNTTQPSFSKETQELLKLMMHESKLTNLQRRKLTNNVKNGHSLPVQTIPARKPINSSPSKHQSPKVMNGRHLSLSGKRKKDAIEEIKQSEDTQPFRPLPGKIITAKDKEQLQNKMAYGDCAPDLNKQRKQPELYVEEAHVDEFDEILLAIEERKEFLDDMEKLGQGKKYRTIIKTEISQKINELERLDKKRTKELEEALKQQKL